jgi:hypothetical protein
MYGINGRRDADDFPGADILALYIPASCLPLSLDPGECFIGDAPYSVTIENAVNISCHHIASLDIRRAVSIGPTKITFDR